MEGTVLGVGSTVEDKYQVLELLGTGGMSNVWLARDRRLDKLWAIKEIRPNVDGLRGERIRRALLDEASFMKRLDHPAIPRIVDIVDTGATAFVIMDYVEGRSLAARMRLQEGAFSQQEVLDWGLQLCDVLSYLHGLTPPVLYRDLKPANIIVREDGSLRLIDFGIAVSEDEARAGAEAAGTPGYAAPEQLPPEGRLTCDLDARADLFSLGVTLYVLASGHAPHVTDGTGDAMRVDFAMRPLRAWNPGLSEGLERIVLRATCAERAARYQTAQEMRYDLEHFEELTQEWRDACLGRMRIFRRRLAGAGASLALGMACLVTSNALREATYADLVHEAQTASRVAEAGEVSQAERLYARAIELEPNNPDTYRHLMELYTADGCFTREESGRWQELCGPVRGLAQDPRYARLCFETAVSYLAYFGVDGDGAAVGNTALESMDAAIPWLERVIEACEEAGQVPRDMDEEDLLVARTYLVIARFHSEATRMAREGFSGREQSRAFWDALSAAVRKAPGHGQVGANPEGVQARLCQACVEALASPSYLAGFARAGVGQDEAEELLGSVRKQAAALEGFAASPEYAAAFGQVLAEVREGLGLAAANIEATYGNPVATWEGL